MPLLRAFAAILLAVAFGAALAQPKYDHKPRHGGVVMAEGGWVYELKVAPKEISVWVTDEANKPVPTAGSKAKVTLIPDAALRAEVPLQPAGDNRLQAKGDFAIKPGSSALLDVEIGGKRVDNLRYVLK